MHKKLLGLLFTLVVSGAFTSVTAQSISISATPGDTICSGTSVTFHATASGGTGYQWLKNSVAIAGAVSNTYITTSLSNGDVIMCELLTTPGGSIAALSAPRVMTVENIPVVAAISGYDTVCRSSTISLTNDSVGGVWNTTNPFIASVTSTGTVTGVTPGRDTILYSITNTCGSDTARVAVYVNVPPALPAITGPANVCVTGGPVTYTDSPATGVWNLSGPAAGTITGGTVTVTTAGIDTVTYTVANSCGVTVRRKLVSFVTAPTVSAIAGATTVCQNDTLHLMDMTPGGAWHSREGMIANILGAGGPGAVVVRGNMGGTATIVYVVTNACGVDSQSIDITVNPLPMVYPIAGRDSVCPGGMETLIEFSAGGTWSSFNSTLATVSATGVVNGLAAGIDTIYYSVTNSCGTVTQAMPLAVYCPANVGVPVGPVADAINIYPNPAHDMIHVQGGDVATVTIVNMYGQTVRSVHNANTVPVAELPQGAYFISVYDSYGNVVAKQQFVKM